MNVFCMKGAGTLSHSAITQALGWYRLRWFSAESPDSDESLAHDGRRAMKSVGEKFLTSHAVCVG